MADLLTECIASIALGQPQEFFAEAGTPEEARRLIEAEIDYMSNVELLRLISEVLDVRIDETI